MLNNKLSYEKFLEIFNPLVFNSIEDLNNKVKELEDSEDEDFYESDRIGGKLRYCGGRLHNIHKVFVLYLDSITDKEKDDLVNQDFFEESKEGEYSWGNQNYGINFIVKIK